MKKRKSSGLYLPDRTPSMAENRGGERKMNTEIVADIQQRAGNVSYMHSE